MALAGKFFTQLLFAETGLVPYFIDKSRHEPDIMRREPFGIRNENSLFIIPQSTMLEYTLNENRDIPRRLKIYGFIIFLNGLHARG